MADIIFYTNPQSRGRIVRWMLEEIGQPYETEVIAYDQMKAIRYLAVNPMGKVPAIKHRGHVVTEVRGDLRLSRRRLPRGRPWPARRRESRLLSLALLRRRARSRPRSPTRRWAGTRTPERERMFGYGNFDRAIVGARRAASRCATMSAATASPPPTSMSARRSCSRCSSACCPSATASSATATGCSRATPTSAPTRSTSKSSPRRKPAQPQPA